VNNKIRLFAIAIAASAALLGGCSHKGAKNVSTPPGSAPDSGFSTSGTGNGDNGSASQLSSGYGDLTQHSVYFDYDKADIRSDGQAVVTSWAAFLSSHPTTKVRLEGNTDERGTREYNVGLGERRANAVATALESRGVSGSQVSVVSYGKERPVATGHDDSAWSQNRRVDIVQE